jgi:hypothetical protein
VRFLHAADPGYDLAIQIQAAQNLLNGNGLSIYSLAGEDDLARPNKLVTLTHFPSGYSFYAAALIAMGLSVAGVLKVGGAAATVLGWWGWARLAYPFFNEGLERGRVWRWVGCAVALCSPLLFTPRWQGTDIFLWAAFPWVLGWLVRGSDESVLGGRWFDLLAGAVCGLCVLMRYSSISLVAYAGFLILAQSKACLNVLARRAGAFAAGLLPLLALQLYLNYFVPPVEANPAGLTVGRGFWGGFEHLWHQLWWLTSANFALVWWMPRSVVQLFTPLGGEATWLPAVPLALLVLLPVLFARSLGHSGLTAASRDVRTAAVGFFWGLPLSLLAFAIVGNVYIGVRRYYTPLLPLAVFVAYAFAAADRKHDGKMQGLLRMTSLGYLTGYLCMSAVGLVLLVLPGERGSGRRAKFASTSELCPWPSAKMIYEFSASRRYVLDLLKDEPGTVLVTNLEHVFYADPSVDRSRLHGLLGLRASHVSGPARILIMAKEPSETPTDALYYWFDEKGVPRRAHYFDDLPNLRLLRRFPAENIKVLEARLTSGTRIALKK